MVRDFAVDDDSRHWKRSEPGQASLYIHHLPDIAYPGLPVVLANRVSSCSQDHAGGLDRWSVFLHREAAKSACVVVDEYRWVGSGYDSWWCLPAVGMAERYGNGCIVLAACTDRFVRHSQYGSLNPWYGTDPEAPKRFVHYQATDYDLWCLKEGVGDVRLATVLHPDADAKQSRSFHTRAHRSVSGRVGGRPLKRGEARKRKEEMLPRILDLQQSEYSLRDIEVLMRIPKSTIDRWIRDHVTENGTANG